MVRDSLAVTEETGALNPPLWRTLREFPRPVMVLLAGVAINRMGSLVQIFLILYLTGIGFSPIRAGTVLAAYGIGSILGGIVYGTISDRIGPRRTIISSMACSAVLIGSLSYVHGYAGLLMLSLAIGTVTYLYWPAALEMLAQFTREKQLVVASAAFRLALNVGAMLAPLIGILLISDSYALVFWVDAVSSLAFAMVALFALPDINAEPRESANAQTSATAGGYLAVLRDRRFLLVLLASLAVALTEVQYQSVLPLQITEQRLPMVLYAIVVTINGAMVIVFELPLTGLIRRLPVHVSMAMGGVLIGVGMATFGLPLGAWTLIVGAVVWTTGEIVSGPSIVAYPALAAPRERLRGRYIGAMSTSQTIGMAVGPILGTALFQFAGSAVWIVCLLLGVLAGTGMWFGAARPRPRAAVDGRGGRGQVTSAR